MLLSKEKLTFNFSSFSKPISLALLGGRGTVGQKIIALINNNSLLSQLFSIEEITSSSVSRKKDHKHEIYGSTCSWKEPLCPMPEKISKLPLISYEDITCPYVLSCLNSEQAKIIEPFLVKKGHYVFSNASTFRMGPNIPLCIPEINQHLIQSLCTDLSSGGCLITNPNCIAVPVALALYALRHLSLELSHVSITSLQSISGAGYPGVPSFDLLGNTIPFIEQEREKILEESQKILHSGYFNSLFQNASFSAQVHRVSVLYGHSISLHLVFKDSVTIEDVKKCYEIENQYFTASPWNSSPLFTFSDPFGPQSRYLSHDFMGVQLGQFMQGTANSTISFTALAHNLVRGAAGAVLNNLLYFLHFLNNNK